MMSKEDVRANLGDLIIIDVRAFADWESGDRMIKGAVREDPDDVVAWASRYPQDAVIVTYCA